MHEYYGVMHKIVLDDSKKNKKRGKDIDQYHKILYDY